MSNRILINPNSGQIRDWELNIPVWSDLVEDEIYMSAADELHKRSMIIVAYDMMIHAKFNLFAQNFSQNRELS